MESFFTSQADFINLITGLLLLLVGAASLSKERQVDARPNWNWFAAFGFLYGINKWMDVLVSNLPSQPIFGIINPFITSVVYFLLFCFSISAYKFKPKAKYLFIVLAAAMSIFSGLEETSLVNGPINTNLKYFFGGLSGFWSFWVLFKSARSGQYRSRYLYLAVIGIPAYSILFALHTVSRQWLYQHLGLSSDLLQMLFVAITVAGIWIGREQYTEEEYKKNFKSRFIDFALTQGMVLMIALLVIVSWSYVDWQGKRQASRLQIAMEASASQTASVFSRSKLLTADDNFQADSLDEKNRVLLQDYLQNTMKTFPKVDRLRLLKPLADGRTMLLATAVHKDGSQLSAQDGFVLVHSNTIAKAWGGEKIFGGPQTDDDGSWYSMFVPWRETETGKIIAIVEVDVKAADYNQQVFIARFLAMLPAGLFFASIILILVYRRRDRAYKILFGDNPKASYIWLTPSIALFLILSAVVLILFFDSRRSNYLALADRFAIYANGGFERLSGFLMDTSGEDVNSISTFSKISDRLDLSKASTIKDIKRLFLGDAESLAWLTANNLTVSSTTNQLAGQLIATASDQEHDLTLGEDVLLRPNYPEAVAKAIDNKLLTALVDADGHVNLFIPIFYNTSQELRGLFTAHYDLEELSEQAVVNSSQSDLVFELIVKDKHDHGEHVLVRQNVINRYQGRYGGARDLDFVAPVNFTDIIAAVHIYPSNDFVKENASNSHWIVLFTGLGASLLLSLYLALVLIGRQRSKALVEERNLDVLRQKNRLQQYIDIAQAAVVLFDIDRNNVTPLNRSAKEIAKSIIKGGKFSAKWTAGYLNSPENSHLKKEILDLRNGKKQVTDNVSMEFVTLNKQKRQFMWRFARLQLEKDVTIIGVGIEVTELNQAKLTIDQLREFDKLKDDILKITSHEFKTPLVSIVGLSEVLYKKRDTLSPDLVRYVEVIHRESLRLNDLVQKMVESARHEKAQVVVKKESVELVSFLSSFEYSLADLVKHNNSKLKFVSDLREAVVNTDKAKITQVINNLVDNAVKYGKEGQTILLRLSLHNTKMLKVEVIDEGQGVKEEDRANLFQKFFRIDSSFTRSQEGIGLGLYLCKQNIELLGGEINVTNVDGGGADFYFTLPLK